MGSHVILLKCVTILAWYPQLKGIMKEDLSNPAIN